MTTRSGAEPGSLVILTVLKKFRFFSRRSARAHRGKSIAALGGLDRHGFDRLLDQIGIVDAAGAELELAAQRARIDGVHVRDHVDGTDAVLAALVDVEGNDEALLGRIVLAGRRNDANVGIAVLEVEAA